MNGRAASLPADAVVALQLGWIGLLVLGPLWRRKNRAARRVHPGVPGLAGLRLGLRAAGRGGETMKTFVALLLAAGCAPAAWAGDPAASRRAMVADIRADVEATSRHIGRRALDPRVLEAMEQVPRHEFVPTELRARAYENRPLPIGHGQTISQPYIVALMTELAEVEPGDAVLELGTGSGYQAAVLAHLGARVYTIEIVPELGESARERLARLGYRGVTVRVGDGYHGWEEHGPFDAILVTAAAGHIPPPLVRQLKHGGRMVLPVGSPFQTQQLTVVEKPEAGAVTVRQLLPVVFVPLTGGH